MAFEVETTASAGIAANAIKVLGKGSAQIRKPLHLFHVVVYGGLASDRPADVAAEFASHNYSIHLLEEEGEPLALFRGVLDVHRRIADQLNGVLFATVAASSPWPASLLPEVVHVEKLHLKGLSERCLILLARRDPERFLPIPAERLQRLGIEISWKGRILQTSFWSHSSLARSAMAPTWRLWRAKLLSSACSPS